MEALLSFLRRLDETGVSYYLGHYTAAGAPTDLGRLTVHVTASPSERWEVEFYENGDVEVERFRSDGPAPTDVDTLLRDDCRLARSAA